MSWSERNGFRFAEFLKRADHGGGPLGGLSLFSALPPLLISLCFIHSFRAVPCPGPFFPYSLSNSFFFFLKEVFSSYSHQLQPLLNALLYPSEHFSQLRASWCGGSSPPPSTVAGPEEDAINEQMCAQSTADHPRMMDDHSGSEPLIHCRSAWNLGWWQNSHHFLFLWYAFATIQNAGSNGVL